MNAERLSFPRLVRSRLRLRVLLPVVSVVLVALAAFDLAAVGGLRSYLMNQTDATLHAAADSIQARLSDVLASVLRQRPATGRGPILAAPDVLRALHESTGPVDYVSVGSYSVLYWPGDGEKSLALAVSDSIVSTVPGYANSATIPPDVRALAAGGGARTDRSMDGTADVRLVAAPAPGGLLLISSGLGSVERTVDRMRLIMVLGSVAAVLVIGLGVFWLLRRGLRPIETMAAQADRITAGDLTERVTDQDPHSEVGRLGNALNGMLTRIETSVHEREAEQELMRRFFADASHELRTPLASLRANAELYQQGALAGPDQVDEVMRRIALESRRMSRLVDDMLRLARLDQHPARDSEPVDLSELVAGCVDRIRVAAPERRWHTELADHVLSVGDEELLRRAVDNLLANVLAHTPQDATATVTLRERHGMAEIEVADTGPGVPAERLPHIFDRFYRAGSGTPGPGAGLGLAIVTQIVTVHGGAVTAGAHPSGGLRVRITLPLPDRLTPDSHSSPAQV
ncbi:sensor histidine kinase [Amycolatopsis jiangsuensis]|uniref:histidine kinase n=1 Tax=Amycolatopsis jiangsuensis TaxID=1181879 RepID=A0A840IVE5_9PSEU|nr:HAMP domain-containing sensor histidine kinase [Amycolatopsis jiangsuensis]MBB4684924.1 two-component system OmpR family sensor kinase [Amycolatopsis jiangsuensis]